MGLANISSSVADEFRHYTASAAICAGLAVLGVTGSTATAAAILSRLRGTGCNLVPGPLFIGRIGHIACSTPETGPRTAHRRFSRKVRVENRMLGEKFRQLSAASLLGLCATSFDVRSQDGRRWIDPPPTPSQTAVELSQPSGSSNKPLKGTRPNLTIRVTDQGRWDPCRSRRRWNRRFQYPRRVKPGRRRSTSLIKCGNLQSARPRAKR
jgi:hypothetical protein